MQYSFPVTSTVNKCHVEHHSQVILLITVFNLDWERHMSDRTSAWIMNYDQCVSVWLIKPRAIRPDVSVVYWCFQIERESSERHISGSRVINAFIWAVIFHSHDDLMNSICVHTLLSEVWTHFSLTNCFCIWKWSVNKIHMHKLLRDI